jgi:hypothetical protein
MLHHELKIKAEKLFEKNYRDGFEFLKSLTRDEAAEVWIHCGASIGIRRQIKAITKDDEFKTFIQNLYLPASYQGQEQI